MWFDAYILAAFLFAIAAPVALIVTRRELNIVRSSIMLDLKQTVLKDDSDLPQLALAAARYRGSGSGAARANRQDGVMVWTGALVFILMSWCGYALLFTPLTWLANFPPSFPSLAPSVLWGVNATCVRVVGCGDLLGTAAIGGFAFLGGYVVQLQYLTRATLNQELSALVFVRAALRLLTGIIVAIVLFRSAGTAMGWGTAAAGHPKTLGAALVIAFVIGYQPDLGLVMIMRAARIWSKSIDVVALQNAKIVPLEIIDGIDSETSLRLQESNLYDIQALATVNPLTLYAETPYTLYESFDWVLQAQLCLVLGTRSFLLIKQHNVRTIFDLERAVLAEGAPPDYVCAIGAVLLAGATPAFRTTVGLGTVAPTTMTVEVVRHMVAIMGDDLHVHRLRALWNRILHTTAGTADGHPQWLFETGPLPGEEPAWGVAIAKPAQAAVNFADSLGREFKRAGSIIPPDTARQALARAQCLVAIDQAIALDPRAREQLRLLWNPAYARKRPGEDSLEPFFEDPDFQPLLA